MKEELTDIRNELYENLPTGEVHAVDLITVIKNHLEKLDGYIDSLQPQAERQVVSAKSAHTEQLIIGDYDHDLTPRLEIVVGNDKRPKIQQAERQVSEEGKVVDDIIEIVQDMDWDVMQNTIDAHELLKKLAKYKEEINSPDKTGEGKIEEAIKWVKEKRDEFYLAETEFGLGCKSAYARLFEYLQLLQPETLK